MKPAHLQTLLAVLLLCVVLALGWLSQRFSTAIDLTANARHSLSETSMQVLKALESPVEVIAVLGPDPVARQGVQALMTRLQAVKPDIALRFINPDTDPEAARALQASPGGELILRSGEREQRLQTLSERSFIDALRLLNREGEREIVFITGHEERSPERAVNDGWSRMAEELAAIGLVSRERSLISEPVLEESIDLVVIAAPRRPFFSGEIASLNDYVNRGGNLLWLSEVPNTATTGPGLQTLADNLGVDTLPGRVIDTASQTLNAESPDFVLLDRLPPHPVNARLNSPILLPQASALSVTPLAGQETLALLQTPASSWTETGSLDAASLAYDDETSEVTGPLLLGVTIERVLPDGVQRLAVIGDADFAASQFLDNGGNRAFTESLFLWLCGDSDALDFVTRKAPDSELTLAPRSIILLSVMALVVLPLSLLLIGGIIRWRRRR